MQRLLSLEQTPPLGVPLRFFLTAPLFAVAAGLVLLIQGPDALLSRWTPTLLALTHLLTLGFLGLIMLGALMQILPVVAGVEIAYPALTAKSAHALLTAGAMALAGGFLSGERWLFQLALPALVIGFAVFLIACWLGIRTSDSDNVTLKAVRLSLWSLLFALAAGLLMLLSYASEVPRPALPLTDLHVMWGLGGWIGLLVVAVAYQVVPMFQMTALYPALLTKRLALAIFLALAGAALIMVFLGGAHLAPRVFQAGAAAGYLVFGMASLGLLYRRKRAQREATTLFWYLALISLAICALLFLASFAVPSLQEKQPYTLMLGMLFIVGFAFSVTNGMLYKILPFLSWYHLQNCLTDRSKRAPNIKQFIPEARARRQFACHVLALILLLAACWRPEMFTHPAALVFILSSVLFSLNLLDAVRLYQRQRQLLMAPDAGVVSE